jgi:hypothetical protein
LLDQVLDDAEAVVDRGLEALHHVKELLNLGLQLDDFLGGGVRGYGHGSEEQGDRRGSEKAIAEAGSF